MTRIAALLPPWRWLALLLVATAAFLYAPLAFGGTTFWTRAVFDWFLVHVFLLWLCVLALERRLPRIPVALVGALVLLVLLGLSQYFNPQAVVDRTFGSYEALEGHLRWLPGSVDAASSGPVLVNLAALLLAGLALRDGLAFSQVRWPLFRIVALAGLVIALIGIHQKAVDSDEMLWGISLPYEKKFFAAFRYHANAASFLNLSWPAAFAVWMRGRMLRGGGVIVSLDFCVFFLVFAAVFVNTSKAGQLLGLLGAAMVAWRFRRQLLDSSTSRTGAVVIALFVLLLAAVFVLPGIFASILNWRQFAADGGSLTGRLLAYQACLGAVRAAGLFGSGAGTFEHVFPYHTLAFEDRIYGYWVYAHQDWLQGIIEWGWLGFAAWSVVFAGALLRLGKRMRTARAGDRTDIAAELAMVALILVLLHSLADFPLQIPALQGLVVFHLAVGWSSPAEDPSRKDSGRR